MMPYTLSRDFAFIVLWEAKVEKERAKVIEKIIFRAKVFFPSKFWSFDPRVEWPVIFSGSIFEY